LKIPVMQVMADSSMPTTLSANSRGEYAAKHKGISICQNISTS